MERVAAAKSAHAKSAYDHTRAEMLVQVDAAWELQVPAPDLGVGPVDPGGGRAMISARSRFPRSSKRIIIPQIALDQASLDEALDFLRVKAAESDITETGSRAQGRQLHRQSGPAGFRNSASASATCDSISGSRTCRFRNRPEIHHRHHRRPPTPRMISRS